MIFRDHQKVKKGAQLMIMNFILHSIQKMSLFMNKVKTSENIL